ncbi:hypothetical protein [Terasakiella sp. SH-1]|uniref:hypothetical protein n=1 Tax=Terasakiella sp. SH-1 TaxID=2560057 RepID=UPI0010745947|nr:hypothetical protein [Terasakiella sp. SH-1]
MFQKTAFLILIAFSFLLTDITNVSANAGFNRLKAAGSGLSGGGGGGDEEEGDGKGGGGKGGKGGRLDGKPAGGKDILYIGSFETYIPKKRYNAKITVFGEGRKFLLTHRACVKIKRIRDSLNQYLFKKELQLDRRGRVDTKGMDSEVRAVIKKALKTKVEYFTSLYVYSGLYSHRKGPKPLQNQRIVDCDTVFETKKEMDRAKK